MYEYNQLTRYDLSRSYPFTGIPHHCLCFVRLLDIRYHPGFRSLRHRRYRSWRTIPVVIPHLVICSNGNTHRLG